MAAKIRDYSPGQNVHNYGFFCPGCGYDHSFRVGSTERPNWDWNGSFESPTFTPSLLCNKDVPEQICHLFVTDGKIIYRDDCHHNLKGQTIEMQDIEA